MSLYNNFINDSKRLLRINSVETHGQPHAPFGLGVKDCLDATLQIASNLGFRTVNGDGYYGYAEIGEGELFGILGHLDTVPLGENWTVPPTEGLIVNEYLYGRGVLDDKVPILSCLYAVAELIKENRIPNKRIRIIFGCDEESGWQCIDKYISCEEMPVLAFTPDGDFPVIHCEKGVAHYTISMKLPSNIIALIGGERCNMVMDKCSITLNDLTPEYRDIITGYGLKIDTNTVTAYGKSAHGSTPNKGDNALWKIIGVLAVCYGGIWKDIRSKLCDNTGYGCGINLFDTKSGALTMNIGTVIFADGYASFEADIRFPISFTKEEILEKLQKSFANSHVALGFYHDPLYIAPDHPLVTELLNAYEEVTGDKAKPITIGGATYARAFPTAVAFGPIFPGVESTIHQKDERVSLSDLRKMYDVYKSAINKLCFNN